MTPEEKAALEAKAGRAGQISTAEFVRRAVAAYDGETERDAAELRAVAGELGDHTYKDVARNRPCRPEA